MREEIRHRDPKAEFYTPERCFIIELSNVAQDPDASIAEARVEPGVTTRWHRLKDTTERYVLLSGSGHIEVGDLQPEHVQAGDVVLIPPGVRQRITNTSDTSLVFLAICTPRFEPAAYEDIDPEPLPAKQSDTVEV